LLALQADAPFGSDPVTSLGEGWVLLGLLRLHLVAPVVGLDPAAQPAMERDSILHRLDSWLEPELQVSMQFGISILLVNVLLLTSLRLCGVLYRNWCFS